MSDPKDTPNKPKLFEREGKPNKPADEPKQPREPADKPDLFPRDPEDPPAEEPTPTPTPRDPADLPKIATERLMDTDADGDGVPDHLRGRDPIGSDGSDLGDITSGPPVGQTVAADSSSSDGGLTRPNDDALGNFEIQDVVAGRPNRDAFDGPSAARIRKDSGEAHDITDDPIGVVVSGGTTMLTDDQPEGLSLNYTTIEAVDHASPTLDAASTVGRSLCDNEVIEADVVGAAVDAARPSDFIEPDPDGDGYYIITMEHVVDDQLDA